MNDERKIDPKAATVLDPRLLVAAAEGREKIEAEKEARAQQLAAQKWERDTNRLFKGIMPRPFRLVMAKQALAKLERRLAEAEEHE